MSRQHAEHEMRETSLEAYCDIELGEMQRRVFDIIVERTMMGHPPTDREIAKELGFSDPNKVRPRRHELMESGLIAEAGIRVCTVSRRRALTWRAIR